MSYKEGIRHASPYQYPDINDDLFVKLLNIKVSYFSHLQALDNIYFLKIYALGCNVFVLLWCSVKK